ncbi:CoA transferase, partial [Enterovirga sp.]|uniref:CaiB/BaiF CoA transferase family protein n=1 Tax=Enterovirga sp. TaxID=2026350 RepID=UPI002602E0AF
EGPLAAEALLARLGPRPAAASAGPSRPLEGVRVVEVGPYTAGPLAGRYLADLGAEVIKVESPGGEVTRSWPPRFGGHGGYFVNCNAGKASVVLDLKAPEDRARFIALVRTSDVLLENLRPGALGKLGLGPADLRRVAPRLVYASVSGFGRDAGARPALDSVVQAEAGLMWLVGAGERPQRVGISIADQAAAHAAPLLILAALRQRDSTGEGQDVDLAMEDVLGWMLELAWPDGDPALAPWSTVPAADGWVVARAESEAVAAVLSGAGELAREGVVARLAAAGIEALAVLEPGEALAHEAVRRRGLVQAVPTGADATVPVLSAPHRFGRGPLPIGAPPGPAGHDAGRLLDGLPAEG